MAADIPADGARSPARPRRRGRQPREMIYRHAVLVRLCHWINALAIFLMVGSGLNIFNAHPRLYWGKAGSWPDASAASISAVMRQGRAEGVTQLGPLVLNTTGMLGVSTTQGQLHARAWPAWLTVPGFQDLADARHWHFFFAWVLVANGLIYLAWSLAARHLQRDLWPSFADLKAIPRSVLDHLRLKHPTGEAAKRYNGLQRLAYLGLILATSAMVVTGLTLSPGINAACPWLLDLFGGRQSARTLHFIFAGMIVLFIAVHLVEVVLAGPLNEVRSMITGRYAVPPAHDR